MIDLHFHCLPGIDDGPPGWDEALALCRAAAADGVETIVATPHILREDWINDDPSARDQLILRLNSLLGDFGKLAQAAAEEFFKRGLVHVVASDAHSLEVRPPRLAAAREKVRKTWGAEAEAGLFEGNLRAIVRNEPLPWGLE